MLQYEKSAAVRGLGKPPLSVFDCIWSGNRTLMNGAVGCPATHPVPTQSGFCSRRAYSPLMQSAGAATTHRRIRKCLASLAEFTFCRTVA
jgi:hypothetical protein